MKLYTVIEHLFGITISFVGYFFCNFCLRASFVICHDNGKGIYQEFIWIKIRSPFKFTRGKIRNRDKGICDPLKSFSLTIVFADIFKTNPSNAPLHSGK